MIRIQKHSCRVRYSSVLALALGAGCSTSSNAPAVREPAQTQTTATKSPAAVVDEPTGQAANTVVTIDARALGLGHIEAGGERPEEPAVPLNTRQITFASEGEDFDPCLTPDGTKLVFASTQHRKTADIYVKNVDGRVVTQLTDDQASDATPSVSPDGTRVAFASDRAGNWDVYVMPITGGRAVQVTSDPADEIHPSWSPDGTHLVFCRHGASSQRWEMWITDVQTQSTSSFIGFGVFPAWCPVAGTGAEGADRILYQLGRERGQHSFAIWTIDIKNGQASNASEVASSSGSAFINPAWSPDGSRIVFASVPAKAEWGEQDRPSSAELWMVGVDGEGKVNLTPGRAVALMPWWGTDNQLYFVGARGGVENIWSLDAAPAIRAAMGNGTSATRNASTGSARTAGQGTTANASEGTEESR